jgi:hypothetical protein
MITVKHIAEGQEHLYEAPYGVTFVGPESRTGIGGDHIEIPKAECAGGFGAEVKCLWLGVAYVMNESGATIGHYRLGAPPESAMQGAVGGEAA